ncbi:Solute carrier family 25 member 45, partial [Eschrichtius robustus]|nr:Solute carrier family 25 member 45 [Eschrichtius robustus]
MPVEEFVAGWISEGPRDELGRMPSLPTCSVLPVRVRLQTQTTYWGIVDCMAKTYRHESLLGFFKGMGFPISSIAVVSSVLFGVYSNALLALTAASHQERWAQLPSYTHVFIAGCAGGVPAGPSGDPRLQTPGLPEGNTSCCGRIACSWLLPGTLTG